MRELNKKRREAGVCVPCGRESGGKWRCSRCLDVHLSQRKHRRENAEVRAKQRAYANARYAALRDTILSEKNKRRIIALDICGGKCVKCGFDDWRSLQLDHVHGNGKILRRGRSVLPLTEIAQQLKDGQIQVLCANCNWIKRYKNKEYRQQGNHNDVATK